MTLTDLQRLEREHLVPAYARMPVEFVRGEGARLWDADGAEYLDFQTGLALRATLSAASLASVPELAKWTLPPSDDAARRSARRRPGSV